MVLKNLVLCIALCLLLITKVVRSGSNGSHVKAGGTEKAAAQHSSSSTHPETVAMNDTQKRNQIIEEMGLISALLVELSDRDNNKALKGITLIEHSKRGEQMEKIRQKLENLKQEKEQLDKKLKRVPYTEAGVPEDQRQLEEKRYGVLIEMGDIGITMAEEWRDMANETSRQQQVSFWTYFREAYDLLKGKIGNEEDEPIKGKIVEKEELEKEIEKLAKSKYVKDTPEETHLIKVHNKIAKERDETLTNIAKINTQLGETLTKMESASDHERGSLRATLDGAANSITAPLKGFLETSDNLNIVLKGIEWKLRRMGATEKANALRKELKVPALDNYYKARKEVVQPAGAKQTSQRAPRTNGRTAIYMNGRDISTLPNTLPKGTVKIVNNFGPNGFTTTFE